AAVLSELLTALDCAPQVLLSAPTGAGKSTWLPLQLLAHPGINGKIILLANMLRSQAARSGCFQSNRPFHPHITLLRDASEA
ncbi:2'-5' RNA ligase family protein, partial [Escherichia sp. TWPC-MK]